MNRCLIFSVAALSCLPANAQEPAPVRPNVILMMADDLAYDDLSCFGSRRITTPRLDSLAKQGLKLTNFYAGASVCSPSRMALLSGSYPSRLGWRWGVLGYGFSPNTGMSPDVYTMAEVFRDAGYRTAMVGKWHLGGDDMLPEHQGFDSTFSIRMSNNLNRDMYADGKLVRKDWDNRRLTEAFTAEAVRLIKEDTDKPFFLYLPWTAPHFPAEPHPDWEGTSGADAFADVVEELDARVGRVLDALQENGLAEDTIVIFTSDNGREKGQEDTRHAPPFSGRKWMSREGGSRVPFIVRWPGRVKPNSTSDGIMSAIDLYPTLASMCHIPIKMPGEAQQIDGMDCSATLLGLPDDHPRTELLYWHGKGQATAYRRGPWKLYFNAGAGDPDVAGGPALYHLEDDAHESRNVAADHPDMVASMLARARQLVADVYARQTPIGVGEGGKAPDMPLKPADVWGPWMR